MLKSLYSIFTSDIGVGNKNSDATERHKKIKSLLLYLSKFSSYSSALSNALSYFQSEKETIKALVEDSVNGYDASIKRSIVSPDFTSFNGNCLPSWFAKVWLWT